jgi:hypothetical protein
VKSLRTSTRHAITTAVAVVVLMNAFLSAQQPSPTTSLNSGEAVHELQEQVQQLRELVDQMRSESAQSRTEMYQLRKDLQATRTLLEQRGLAAPSTEQNAATPAESSANSTVATAEDSPIEERVQKLEEATSLIGAKVDEQFQTKVETASKYRARLHGIVLMNAFRNVGGADNVDFPVYAVPLPGYVPQANMGATLRQSQIGLEIFGPEVFGAKSSADVQLDFAGGFPATGNGVNFGIARLQTASVRLDWDRTSVIAGQDSLFLSPLSPTSFASLATPTFAFAGNLWGWTPQVRIEHRFSLADQQTLTMQAGILDNLDWEPPYSSFERTLQAGEMSGQPAYAFRTAWTRPVQQHPLTIGVAGYYGRQNWSWSRIVDAWGGTVDWTLPILPRLQLSGEFYRGLGIGGLGGGIGTSVVYGSSLRYGPLRGVDTAGGWTQLKLQLTPKWELNGAVAQDDAFTANIRGFAIDQDNGGAILGRNRGALGNFVFRPRSDLVFSAELRRLQTFPVYSSVRTTNQVNLAMGILF